MIYTAQNTENRLTRQPYDLHPPKLSKTDTLTRPYNLQPPQKQQNRYARAVCKGKSSCSDTKRKAAQATALAPASADASAPSQEGAALSEAETETAANAAAARRRSSGKDSRRTSLERGQEGPRGGEATIRTDGKGEGGGVPSSWQDRLMAVQRQRAVLEETMRAAKERLLEKRTQKEVRWDERDMVE